MKMYHPQIEALADVVDSIVFNAVWAPRGWCLLPAPEAFASEVLVKAVKRLDDLKADELRMLVSARGLEYPAASVKKADIVAQFLDTFANLPSDSALEAEALPLDSAPAETNNTNESK